MLTCLRVRGRLGAYLDGALEGAQAEVAARHLGGCARCRREADGLRRTRALLQRSLSPTASAPEPDWTGFWPGIVRGIEGARREAPVATARIWLRPRWVFGGALMAAFLVSMTLWQTTQAPPAFDGPVIVRAANTDHPQASVMVYQTPDRDMTVVWVFGLDD
ncbi:MAG: zf-HC2 domain-containing protein [Candidatus Rokubacteria bacterium]|nr:zf-HC2 domain-containing protein [Candidatus Rokubacteria bacterium]